MLCISRVVLVYLGPHVREAPDPICSRGLACCLVHLGLPSLLLLLHTLPLFPTSFVPLPFLPTLTGAQTALPHGRTIPRVGITQLVFLDGSNWENGTFIDGLADSFYPFLIVFRYRFLLFDFSLMDGLGYWYWYRGYNTTCVFGGQLSGGNSNDGDDGSDAG